MKLTEQRAFCISCMYSGCNPYTNIFFFFWKRIVIIASSELGPVSNERFVNLTNFTFYKGKLEFQDCLIFEGATTFFLKSRCFFHFTEKSFVIRYNAHF